MQSNESIEALRQLKVSSESRLDAQYELSKRVNESYYNYAMATPEITKKALALASEETRKIYLDYVERLTRLNEQVMQRIIEASDEALKKCMDDAENTSQTNASSKRRVNDAENTSQTNASSKRRVNDAENASQTNASSKRRVKKVAANK